MLSRPIHRRPREQSGSIVTATLSVACFDVIVTPLPSWLVRMEHRAWWCRTNPCKAMLPLRHQQVNLHWHGTNSGPSKRGTDLMRCRNCTLSLRMRFSLFLWMSFELVERLSDALTRSQCHEGEPPSRLVDMANRYANIVHEDLRNRLGERANKFEDMLYNLHEEKEVTAKRCS